jgi:hypothetical protein
MRALEYHHVPDAYRWLLLRMLLLQGHSGPCAAGLAVPEINID